MRFGFLLGIVFGLAIAVSAHAQEPTPAPAPPPDPIAIVTLKDGSVVRGVILGQTQETLTLRTAAGDLALAQGGIANVEFPPAGPPDAGASPEPGATPVPRVRPVRPKPPAVDGPPSPFYIDGGIFTGFKGLTSSYWTPVGGQVDFGLEATVGLTKFPVKLAIDVSNSTGSNEKDDGTGTGNFVTTTGTTTEYAIGARYVTDGFHLHYFGGAGFLVARAALYGDRIASVSGAGPGVWAGGGAFVRFGPRFNIGGTLRYSFAPVTLGGTHTDAGGVTGGIFFGWSFGGATQRVRPPTK